jgi:hypothetical protein
MIILFIKDCINLFLGYNTVNDSKAAYDLLNKEYATDNNINENKYIK